MNLRRTLASLLAAALLAAPLISLGYTGSGGVFARKTGVDFASRNYPGTRIGIQQALDYVGAGGGTVQIGPGVFSLDSCLWAHSGTIIYGAGPGRTTLRRTSMSDADPSNSGAVLAFGPGHGTAYSSGSTGSKVEVADLTLDGGASSFGAITNANLVPKGLRVDYIDGVSIHNVIAYNVLGTGFEIRGCRNVSIVGITGQNVGQSSISNLGKNGLSMVGDAGAAGEWGINYNVTNVTLKNVGDEAVFAAGIRGLSFSGLTADTCDFVWETSNAQLSTGYTAGNWAVSNLTARNVLSYFVTFAPTENVDYQNISFTNMDMSGDPSLHDGGVLALPSVSGVDLDGFSFSHGVFRNINTKDTTFRHWIDSQPGSVAGRVGLTVTDVQMYGKAGSVRTGSDIGINLRGSHKACTFTDVLLQDVPGTGVRINDNAAVVNSVATDITFNRVTVNGANDWAFRTTNAAASSASTIRDVHFNQCIAKDSNKQTSGAAFQLFTNQTGTTTQRVFLRGCTAYKTSGSTLTYGLDLNQSGSGVLDEVSIDGCDFSGTQTNWLVKAGAPTHIHFRPPPGRGSDIVAAASIVIPQNGSLFHVTGNTNVTNAIQVDCWDNGRRVTLIFEGTPTVTDTGTSKLNGNFVAAGTTNDFDALVIESDATNWYECSRSAN